MRKLLIIWLFIVWGSGIALSQGFRMSKDPEAFIEDLSAVLAKQPDSINQRLSSELSSIYSSLNEDQRARFYQLTWKFYNKKFRINRQFSDFFFTLSGAINEKGLKGEQLDVLLTLTERSLEELTEAEFNTFLRTLKDFFNFNALYQAPFNRLITSSNAFVLEWAGPPPEKVPEVAVEEDPMDQRRDEVMEEFNKPEPSDDWGGSFEEAPAETQEKANVEDVIANAAPPTADIPPLKGPLIRFTEPIDLEFYSAFDSTVLKGTEGALMLSNFTFVGKGGKFDWTTVEIPEEEVYAELAEYSFNTMNASLDAEGAKLHYDKYLYEPLEGSFSFRSIKRRVRSEKSYPRFVSYNNNVDIKDLGPGIEYRGGFSLIGQKRYSTSINQDLSFISVQYNNELKFRANSPRFELLDTALLSDKTSIVIYTDKDSVYHPVVRLHYSKEIPDLRLYASKGAYKKHPYTDTYHKLFITAEKLYYDLTQDSLEFATYHARDVLPVIIESKDYFRESEYEVFRNNNNYNILNLVVIQAIRNRSEQLYIDDLKASFKVKRETALPAIIELAGKGFIKFNPSTGRITVLQKAYHFYKAHAGKTDYDNIQISSFTSEDANVRLNIRDNAMVIRGVQNFTISDSLNVAITPRDGIVDIADRRNMKFHGKLVAGNYVFSGENFRFSYDSFLVDMVQIDSIDFIIRTIDTSSNREVAKKLLNNLQRTSGVLLINEVNNKSGKKKIARYPTFDLDQPAYVFFNQPNVLGGVYDERIYFEVPPFGLDSMNSDDPSTISFNGTMYSDGLFPDFEYVLKVMPDLSLGFVHDLPQEGFEIYNGKGKLYSNLKLDGNGFTSNGQINYLASTATSDKFVFYQDSLTTIGKSFKVEGTEMGGLSFAGTNLDSYQMSWLIAEDSMVVRNMKNPFTLYEGKSRFRGEMVLSSLGMNGIGRWEDNNAIVKGNNIQFNEERFKADEAVFQIKSEDPYKPAVFAHDVNVDYELNNRQATFIPVYEGEANIDFPYMQYKTSIPKGVWNFDDNTVTMSMDEGEDIDYSFFYSTRPDQDSLVFNAVKGVYDIKTSQMTVYGIPHIQVADAKIVPENGTVVIKENAEMQQLQNAVIIVDTLNEYHTLNKGTIDIFSRYRFQGRGDYRYANVLNDTFDIIFDDFQSELQKGQSRKSKFGSTTATGTVPDEEPIVLGPRILYKGNVKMYAFKPKLEFDGFVKLDIKATEEDETQTDWFAFKSTGETEDIVLNTAGIKSQDGQPLVSGLHIQSGSSLLYNTFVAVRTSQNDKDVITAEGDLTYDVDLGEFTIGPKEKLEGKSMVGNVLVFEDKTKRLRYEGAFNFIHESPDIKASAAGSGDASLDSGIYRFNTLLTLAYQAPPNAFMVMADKVEAAIKTQSTEVAAEDPSALLFRLAEIIGQEPAKQWDVSGRTGYVPLLQASSKISGAITLAEVNLEWNEDNRAWFSQGQLGVSNIYKKDINAKMDGYLEIRKLLDGEAVFLYLQPTLDTWYFLSYDRRVLSMVSSKRDFNDLILARTKGSEPAPDTYGVRLAEPSEKRQFVRDFKINYLRVTEAEIDKQELEQEQAEIEADDEGQQDVLSEEEETEETGLDPFADQPTKKVKKKDVEIDPFTGEEVEEEIKETQEENLVSPALKKEKSAEKKFEIDPFTGEKIEVEEEKPVEEKPVEDVKSKKSDKGKKTSTPEESTGEEEEIDPFTGEPVQKKKPSKKKEVDPFTGEEIEEPSEKPAEESKPLKKKKDSSSKERESKGKTESKPSETGQEEQKRNEEEVDPFTGEPLAPAEKPKPKKEEPKPEEPKKEPAKPKVEDQEVDPFTGEPVAPVAKPKKEEPKPKSEEPKKEPAKPKVEDQEVDPFTGEPVAPIAKPKKEEPKPEEPKKEPAKPKAEDQEVDPFTGEPVAPVAKPKKEEPKPEEPKKEPAKPKVEDQEVDPFTGEPVAPAAKPLPKKEESKPSAIPDVKKEEPNNSNSNKPAQNPVVTEPERVQPKKEEAKPAILTEPKKEEPKPIPPPEPKKEEPKPVATPKKEPVKPAIEEKDIDPFSSEPSEPAAKPKVSEPKTNESKPAALPAKDKPKPKPESEEVDPFTGEPISPAKSTDPKTKSEEVDPFTGEPIKKEEPKKVEPKKEEPKKEEPKKEEKKPKKQEIDPFTGEPIDDGY